MAAKIELLTEVKQVMEAIQQQIKEQIKEPSLESFLNRSTHLLKVEKLPGDASTRKYYRAFTKDEKYPTLIVMVADSFEAEGNQWPFLAVQRHLYKNGVDVPAVLDTDPARGFVLLEDLGDVTLLRSLQECSDRKKELNYYNQAVDILLQLHRNTGPGKGESLAGFELRFDHEKLMWEVQFCIEHFYEGYLARKWSGLDKKIITDGFSKICSELDRQPTVFTHRDYHSRNIMEKNGKLYMIDFQDARMGPTQYDLASLLRDSYYQLDDSQVDQLSRKYFDAMKDSGKVPVSYEEFVRVFDFMSIQRNFKAIGSFASFYQRRGNPGYLKYIGNTFENIRRNLLKYPEYTALRETLFHYYYF